MGDWQTYYFDNVGLDGYMNAVDSIKKIYPELDNLTVDKYVHFRIIGQTWNGFVNELNVINELDDEFENIDFFKAPYILDEMYFTDWEAYIGNTKLFGIQIKPITYKYMNTPYQIMAKANHEKQRDLYKEKYGVPHYIFYYENNKLYDKQYAINQINTCMALKIQVNK